MSRLLLAVCLALPLAACAADRMPGDGLPFYDEATFTPRWGRTVAHRIGDFALRTQTGETLHAAALAGRIHVASFVYTRCAGICPTMVHELGKVQAALATTSDVVMLSYSVTPDLDTPEVLAAFGREHGIDPGRWLLLTGDARRIYALARTSYFADDTRATGAGPGADGDFLHSEKVLLVDRQGRLRGVYNGTLPFDIERLIADIATLRAETL